jgi:RNA polymerase sigma factor (sigma-70 family)
MSGGLCPLFYDWMSDTLRDYLNQIGKIPLLTAAEEIELGHAIQRMMALDATDPKNKEEQRIMRIGRRAKNRMIQGNLRLVIGVASKYKHLANRLSLHDLIQEGNIGLIRAVELFDPERGYKFSTYAYWWIRQGIMRSIQVQDRIIKLPSGANDLLRKVKTYRIEYQEEYGTPPTIEQCAEYAEVTPETMRSYIRGSSDAISLDVKVSNTNDDSSAMIDFVAAIDQQPEEEILLETKIEAVQQALEHMNSLHKQAIVLRFGLNGDLPCSKREISRKLGIAQDTVKRLLDNAQSEIKMILSEGPPGKSQRQKCSSSLIWGWG